MVKRILDCARSDFEKMSSRDLFESIKASEGRTLLAEIYGPSPPLVWGVSNPEIAVAFGADLIMLNGYDVNNPVIVGVPTEKEPFEIPGIGKLVGFGATVNDVKKLIGRPVGINLEAIEPQIPSSVFISGSKVAKHTNFVALLNLQDQFKDIHISSTGGTQNWRDIVEFIMYGASSVQVQTLFLQKGMGLIEKFKKEISNYMDSKGFDSIEEMKGAILPKLLTFDEVISTYGETKGKIVVAADQEKCIGCGVCQEVCNWEAIRVIDDKVEIAKDKCEGCGVCVCSCAQEALWLENAELIKKLARG